MSTPQRARRKATTRADYLRRLPPPHARRAIREAAGVSLADVAAELDVSASVVRMWEQGKRGFSHRTLGPYVRLLESLEADQPNPAA